MSSKIKLRDAFAYPTIRQDHNTELWDTAIGRRNYLITAEKVLCSLCANPEWVEAPVADIINQTTLITEAFYEEMEYRES